MGQNKAQRAAAARAAEQTAPATTTPAATEQPTAVEVPGLTEALQLAAELCGPKTTAKAHKTAAAKTPRPICTSTKKDGTACTARCIEGKQTCVDHQPAWDRLTHDEHVAFGSWLRKAKGPEIVEVIGWWKAKQIAADVAGAPTTEEQDQIEK